LNNMSGTNYIASNWRVPENSNSSKNDNYSLDFSGSSYIDLTQQNLGTINTISLWIKNPIVKGVVQETLLGNPLNTFNQFLNVDWNTGKMFYKDNSNNRVEWNTLATINDTNWNNIIITRSGATVTLYFNGEDQGTGTTTGTLGDTEFRYLGINFNTNTQAFDGDISDFAAFDYALDSDQRDLLLGGTETGAGNPMALKPTPVAYYPLGDNSASDPVTQPNVSVDDASVFDFNASSNQEIDCGDILHNDGQTPMTISAWVKISTAASHTNLAPIASKKKTRKAPTYIMDGWEAGFITSGAQTNRLYFSILGDGTVATGSLRKKALTLSFTDGLWHHVVITYDGSGDATGVKFYIDGIEDTTTQTLSNNLSGTIPNAPSEHFMIGETPKYGGTNWMDGEMSNLQIWDVKLENAEVLTLYNNGVPLLIGIQPQVANLEAWYKLDQSAILNNDGSFWTIEDSNITPTYTEGLFFGGGYIGGSPSVNYAGMRLTNQTISSDHVTNSFWFKLVKPTTGSSTAMVKAGGYLGEIRVTSSGVAQWSGDSAGKYINFGTNVGDGAWHHILVYYPNTTTVDHNDVRCFIDGSEATKTLIGGSSSTGPQTSIQGILQQSAPLNVILSNWSYWLSDQTSNIDIIYNNGTPGDISSLNPDVWLKFDNATTSFNGVSGAEYGLATDSSGNSNDGNLSGKTSGIDTKLDTSNVQSNSGVSSGMTSGNLVLSDLTRNLPYENYSLDLDGTEEINCGDITTLNGASKLTFNLWIKYSSNLTFQIILGESITSTATDVFQFYNWASGVLYCWIKTGGTGTVSFVSNFSSLVNIDEWHMLTLVYDGTQASNNDRLSIHLDGDSTNIIDNYGTIPTTYPNISDDFYIGKGFNGGFNGKMSNVSIFNKILTLTEIQKLYANGLPQDLTSFTPQPSHWWTLGKESFWNGSNWIVRDMTGSNDGTSSNMAVSDLVGDAPRSEANGTATNMDIPTNLVGNAGFSDKNAYSINMGPTARVTDTP